MRFFFSLVVRNDTKLWTGIQASFSIPWPWIPTMVGNSNVVRLNKQLSASGSRKWIALNAITLTHCSWNIYVGLLNILGEIHPEACKPYIFSLFRNFHTQKMTNYIYVEGPFLPLSKFHMYINQASFSWLLFLKGTCNLQDQKRKTSFYLQTR